MKGDGYPVANVERMRADGRRGGLNGPDEDHVATGAAEGLLDIHLIRPLVRVRTDAAGEDPRGGCGRFFERERRS